MVNIISADAYRTKQESTAMLEAFGSRRLATIAYSGELIANCGHQHANMTMFTIFILF